MNKRNALIRIYAAMGPDFYLLGVPIGSIRLWELMTFTQQEVIGHLDLHRP
jgi:hypothetical protein